MLFSPRVNTKALAQLCRRVGTSLEAGIDARKVFAGEAERGGLVQRRQLASIKQAVHRGSALTDALQGSGHYFPPLFREMVAVGEATGKLDAVLLRLADHYEDRVRLRRIFLAGIAWPMIQLVAAILVIGLLIWVLGVVGDVDILGFGLMGTRGLMIYLGLVSAAALFAAVLIFGAVRGWFWSRPLEWLLLITPALGSSLKTVALSRMAWTMSLTFDSGMDALRALELAVRSTGYRHYTDRLPNITLALRGGSDLHQALQASGVFPVEFLDTLEVGEQSGRLAESMAMLANQYRDRAVVAFRVLAVVAGFVIWGMVAALIIALIFRLAGFYIGTIKDAAEGRF